jgi:plastocyanin
MPGPSFRPAVGALGMGMLMLGLVFGGWLMAAGFIALVATLVGWLSDARQEYIKVEEADTTGHLENVPRPRTPSALLWVLGVLLVGAVVLQAGWLPPRDVSGGEGATGSGAPPASGEPGGSGGPAASPAGPVADVVIHAKNTLFVEPSITAPADKAFTLAFVNEDPGGLHNVEFKDGGGASVFKGDIFAGVDTHVYDVPPLPAGAYMFVCSVHSTMTGTATLQ